MEGDMQARSAQEGVAPAVTPPSPPAGPQTVLDATISHDEAFELERQVIEACEIERQGWLPLAQRLCDFHAQQAWRLLGWEKFTDWIADPEIGIGRRHAYRLIACWAWLTDHKIGGDVALSLDVTKLALVIGAETRGEVTVEEAIADAQSLSRLDLAHKYLNTPDTGTRNVLTEQCEACGRQVVKERE